MIRFPNAKINLGLRIVARRPDGYHNIETVFYPIQLQDALEIVPTSQQETKLSLSGMVIDGDPQNNLVMKAWRRLSVFRYPRYLFISIKPYPLVLG